MFLKPYIFNTTIFLLFSEVLQIHVGIDLRLSYLIILSNLFIIIAMYPQVVLFNKAHLAILGYLTLTGIYSIFRGTNALDHFGEQIAGITISSIYFYLFFKLFSDKDLTDIFKAYCNVSYIVIIIGLLKMIKEIFIPQAKGYWRFESIFSEPSHSITVLFPALYYYLKTGTKIQMLICFTALVLSFSSVGYMAFAVLLIINIKINIKQLAFTIGIAAISFYAAYTFIPLFNERINDTINSLIKADVSAVNLSSFALVSNFFVAAKSFISSPFLGSGLGSHEISHAKYIASISGVEQFKDNMDINSKDANSLFIRVISDLGLIGIISVFYFIKKYYQTKTHSQSIITKGIFLYFFCKLLREGHYFTPEMYFFVFIYYFNSKKDKSTNETYFPANNTNAISLAST